MRGGGGGWQGAQVTLGGYYPKHRSLRLSSAPIWIRPCPTILLFGSAVTPNESYACRVGRIYQQWQLGLRRCRPKRTCSSHNGRRRACTDTDIGQLDRVHAAVHARAQERPQHPVVPRSGARRMQVTAPAWHGENMSGCVPCTCHPSFLELPPSPLSPIISTTPSPAYFHGSALFALRR